MKNRVSSAVRPPKEQPWQTYLWALQGVLYIFTAVWVMISYFYGKFTPLKRALLTDSFQACHAKGRHLCVRQIPFLSSPPFFGHSGIEYGTRFERHKLEDMRFERLVRRILWCALMRYPSHN